MSESFLQLESHWGVTLNNRYIDQNNDTLTVILQGEGYTNEKPLMYYSYKVALELGLDVLCVDYGFQSSHKSFDLDAEFDIVASESLAIIKKALSKSYKRVIFIGKSLGTIIQSKLSKELIDYDQVHVYLTPVDKSFETTLDYPCLVITGTEDKKINSLNISAIERSKNVELVKIDRANHRLECLDSLASIEMLNASMKKLKEFIVKFS